MEGSEVIARFLHGDLTTAFPSISLGSSPMSGGWHPIARERASAGFLVISIASDVPAITAIDGGMARSQTVLLQALRFHGLPSFAMDREGYVVVTELADQYGPGCWVSKLTDTFAVTSGPATLETTQQADCDSSTVTASAGVNGVGMVWMDRDPANSNVEFP